MTHQVFVNFRGAEIRKTFMSHLLSSFNTKSITSFIASKPFEDQDLKAMEQSQVAIPVISKNYVTSDLWLDDLRKIIECEKIGTLTAIPIFFQVDPLDIISHAAGKYVDAQNESLEMVRNWLSDQESRKSSFHSNDWEDDSELVVKITSFVSDILESSTSSYHSTDLIPSTAMFGFKFSNIMHLRSLSLPRAPFTPVSLPAASQSPLVDMKRHHVKKLRAILLRMRTESIVIGICGMEGVGKTTLARNLYEEITPRFQHHIYIKNVINRSQCPFSLLDMLSSEAFKESSFHGSSHNAIKEMIGHRKVLVVADGVDDSKQLKGIIKDASWFGPGSRVIVITQERSLLSECGVKHIYEVECPRYEKALAFFSEFAFKQSSPLPLFEDLSFRAVHVANRLPLALKVLGSFLHDKDKDEWESTLCKLEASRDNYASQVSRYIGVDDYAPRRPIKVDRHIGVDEANCFPLYCLDFK